MKTKLFLITLITAFAFQFSNAQWNPRPGWKDSYKANNLCWCDTNFDHNLGSKSLRINNRNYNIKKVCQELKKHPLFRNSRNGDTPYNDIQCGNGPANDAPDEAGCPGRVDIGSRGCNQKGPKYDMNWLKSRPAFGGNGGGGDDDDDDDDNGNKTIGLKADNGRFVSSEDGRSSMTANRNKSGRWEKFILIALGGDTYALRASNGRYVSSEDGRKEMTANRKSIGRWEKFTMKDRGGNNFSLQGSNGKYVSLQFNSKLRCNSSKVTSKEKFNIPTGLNRVINKELLSAGQIIGEDKFYIKNPIESGDLISVNVPDVTDVVIYNYEGRKINSFKPSENFTIETSGFYIMEFVLGENKSVRKKIVVK